MPLMNGDEKVMSLAAKLDIGLDALRMAMKGYETLKENGTISNSQYLTIVDYSKPSNTNRFYVIDMFSEQLVIKSLVAHGKNSGTIIPTIFSNKDASLKSSLGFFVTGSTYKGKHGTSLQLEGVEQGINDHAKNRAIVIHGAKYVSDQIVQEGGSIGRSFGCPAVPNEQVATIIATIKEGACLFIYAPDKIYLEHSLLIK